MKSLRSAKVSYLLDKYKETRNDDTLLYIRYLQEYICETEIEKAIIEKVLLKGVRQSSLQRIRAWYQNFLKIYLPEAKTINKRKKMAEKIKEKIREAKKDKLGF